MAEKAIVSANAKRLSDRQVIVLSLIGNAADAARGSRHSTDWMRAGITSLVLMNYFNFDYFSEADRLLAGLERRELIRTNCQHLFLGFAWRHKCRVCEPAIEPSTEGR